jgi:hypothetical protein
MTLARPQSWGIKRRRLGIGHHTFLFPLVFRGKAQLSREQPSSPTGGKTPLAEKSSNKKPGFRRVLWVE